MERIYQKIGRINEYIRILEKMQPDCIAKFDKDLIYRGAMLHYLYLVVDSCIVLAEMTIKKKNLRPPQSYAESFDILGESGILDPEFAYDFSKIAGFRNFLSHDYEAVDARIICNHILAKIGDIRKFIDQITLNAK
ncbi:MAG: DUF86 domain-containing protein [Desulfotignum sp.]|nr:DUF86 domain-containing protein [Desulfotignum sp.]MCF8137100.1 DUF86 domain-containing protein [Desulfotignum sp.]